MTRIAVSATCCLAGGYVLGLLVVATVIVFAPDDVLEHF